MLIYLKILMVFMKLTALSVKFLPLEDAETVDVFDYGLIDILLMLPQRYYFLQIYHSCRIY